MPSGCEKCPRCGQDTLQRNYRGYDNGEALCLQVNTCGYWEAGTGVRSFTKDRDLERCITNVKRALFRLEELCETSSSQYIKAMFRLLDGIREDETRR